MPKINQKPAELHVEIYQGDSWRLHVTMGFDLTDYDIAATVHPKGGGTDIEMSIEPDDLTTGEFEIVLTAAASLALPADYNDWCLVLTPPHDPEDDPEPRTYIAGSFIVEAC